jgi:hypothetical protein
MLEFLFRLDWLLFMPAAMLTPETMQEPEGLQTMKKNIFHFIVFYG